MTARIEQQETHGCVFAFNSRAAAGRWETAAGTRENLRRSYRTSDSDSMRLPPSPSPPLPRYGLTFIFMYESCCSRKHRQCCTIRAHRDDKIKHPPPAEKCNFICELHLDREYLFCTFLSNFIREIFQEHTFDKSFLIEIREKS